MTLTIKAGFCCYLCCSCA